MQDEKRSSKKGKHRIPFMRMNDNEDLEEKSIKQNSEQNIDDENRFVKLFGNWEIFTAPINIQSIQRSKPWSVRLVGRQGTESGSIAEKFSDVHFTNSRVVYDGMLIIEKEGIIKMILIAEEEQANENEKESAIPVMLFHFMDELTQRYEESIYIKTLIISIYKIKNLISPS